MRRSLRMLFVLSALPFALTLTAQNSQPATNQNADKTTKPGSKKVAAAKPPANSGPTQMETLRDARPGEHYSAKFYIPTPAGWNSPVSCELLPGYPTWLSLSMGKDGYELSGDVKSDATTETFHFLVVCSGANNSGSGLFAFTLPLYATPPMTGPAKAAAPATAPAQATPPAAPSANPAPTQQGQQSSNASVSVDTKTLPANFAVATVNDPVQEGTTSITGQITGVTAKGPQAEVEVFFAPHTGGARLLTQTSGKKTTTSAKVDATSGSFTITLDEPIQPDPVQDGMVCLRVLRTDTDAEVTQRCSGPISPRIPRPQITLDGQPDAGASTLAGHLDTLPNPAVASSTVGKLTYPGNLPEVAVWVRPQTTGRWEQAELLATPKSKTTASRIQVDPNGRFDLNLKTPLAAGDQIVVEALPPDGHEFATTGRTFAENNFEPIGTWETAVLSIPGGLDQPTITTDPLKDGTTALTGTATKTIKGGATYGIALLRVYPGDTKAASLGCLTADSLNHQIDVQNATPGSHYRLLAISGANSTTMDSVATNADGDFKATLTQALYEGEKIVAVQVLPAGSAQPDKDSASNCVSTVYRVRYEFDWYRTNLTFAAGLVVSNSSTSASTSSFSQANQFYDMTVDRAWWMPGYACVNGRLVGGNSADTVRKCMDGNTPLSRWKTNNGVPGINTFFETRLTAIPVSSNTASTSTTTAAPTTTTTGTSTFLSTQKSVQVNTGIYLPWVLGHGAGDHPSAIFLAPIAKAGFNTLTGSQTITQNGTPLYFENAYNFYNFGGRVGQFHMSASNARAPRIDSYFDVTMGRYQNLTSYICHASVLSGEQTGSSCGADYGIGTNWTDSRKALYRLDVEGLARIPIPATAIPFYIGINANVAQHTLGAVRLDHGLATPDDIRIFFGTKFDIGSLLSSLNLGTGVKTKSDSQ